jgi:integrase
MKANHNTATAPEAAPRLGRIPKSQNATGHRQRFRILNFTNATGTKSYRVQGMDRRGKYIRQNFASLHDAQLRQIELEADFHSRQPDANAIRATSLSEVQIRLAESAFLRLDADEELPLAVGYWIEHGRDKAVVESPRLDEAVGQFTAWLAGPDCALRPHSKQGLKIRVAVFGNSAPNCRISAVTTDGIEQFIGTLKVSAVTRDNYRRAVSRFFSWCMERPRRWARSNPCREVKITKPASNAPPVVLAVSECEQLLRAAETYRDGLLVPYVSACLFAGLRPFEASRLTWSAVNLEDGEIRLEASQTKTKRPRVITIVPTLKTWLEAYQGKAFFPTNWRRHFDAVKAAAGFSSRDGDGGKPWIPDAMRHTAVSHHFRECGSYGRTAEAFGNSEAIIKTHYQGRVSTADTAAFYALRPTKGSK